MSEPAPVDPVCQVCGEAIANDMVWCVDCSTPHHRDCFAYNGRCSVFGCTGMRFKETAEDARGVVWIDVKDEQGEAVPQGYVVEFTSGREAGALGVGCFFLFLAFVFIVPPKNRSASGPLWLEGAGVCAALGIVCWILYAGLRDYRIVDGKTRKIWLHRSFFGRKSLTPDIEFDQVRRLVLAGRYEVRGKSRTKGVAWRLVAHLASGGPRPLTDEEFREWSPEQPASPGHSLYGTGQRVARILGRELEQEVRGLPGGR